MKEIKSLFGRAVLILTFCADAGLARAQFTYNEGIGQYGDLLICFRPASGSYDLVVDAGPVTAFTSLTVGQKITITNYYSPSQLKYTGTNNIYWCALARQTPGGPVGNIWVTRPRTSLNTQSAPWPCKSSSQQNTTGSQIDSIGDDASNIGTGGDPFGTSPANGNSFVVEPEGGSSSGGFYNSYSYQMINKDGYGDLDGNFWGDSSGVSVEQSTPANFTTAGQPVRADFYQLLSVSNGLPATYLGYFELSPNGVLTYTAGPSPTTLTAPHIVSYVHKGTTNTISFTTVSGGTYTLRGTNSAGLGTAVTNWPAIGSSLAGDGLTDSLVEVITNSSRLYTITAQ
jgi:hypothetical protein